MSEFELKLMDINSENLGIPETEYSATVRMPAGEFQRIVKDLASIGDTGAQPAPPACVLVCVAMLCSGAWCSWAASACRCCCCLRRCFPCLLLPPAVELCVTKDGIKFAAAGDIGSATVVCRQNSSGKEEEQTLIDMNETVSLTFALRYLVNFTKATALSPSVVSVPPRLEPCPARPMGSLLACV